MSSFSAFSPTKTELWAAASPCLQCFDGGAQSVGRGAVTCSLSSTQEQHFSEIMSNSAISHVKK